MALVVCPQCSIRVSDQATACPGCGHPLKEQHRHCCRWRGFEWKSKTEILGWPLMHIAFGRNKTTGRLLVARGIIAIGQFGIGLITIAQFGLGFLFGFGQFIGGFISVAQFAAGIYFGLGQFATGVTAIGQFAVGKYILAQAGYGQYIWSVKIKDPRAVEYFTNLWQQIKDLKLPNLF